MKKEIINRSSCMAKANIFTMLCILFCFGCLVACSGSTAPKDIANKLASKAELTDEDYGVMIDYCGEYAEDYQSYQDILDDPESSEADKNSATNNLANLTSRNPYYSVFSAALYGVELRDLSKENQEKVKKYDKFTMFPLPGGAGLQLEDPNVEGMIEDMPDSTNAADSDVIATGDGEAVDVTVK